MSIFNLFTCLFLDIGRIPTQTQELHTNLESQKKKDKKKNVLGFGAVAAQVVKAVLLLRGLRFKPQHCQDTNGEQLSKHNNPLNSKTTAS